MLQASFFLLLSLCLRPPLFLRWLYLGSIPAGRPGMGASCASLRLSAPFCASLRLSAPFCASAPLTRASPAGLTSSYAGVLRGRGSDDAMTGTPDTGNYSVSMATGDAPADAQSGRPGEAQLGKQSGSAVGQPRGRSDGLRCSALECCGRLATGVVG